MLKGIEGGPRYGIMVCGHGSRNQNAVGEFSKLAIRLRERFPQWPVEYGYLEFANPVIRDGLDRLREAGCDRILAVPGMLFAAMHAKNDIPTVLNTYAAKHGMQVSYGRELGVDPKMIAAAAGRSRRTLPLRLSTSTSLTSTSSPTSWEPSGLFTLFQDSSLLCTSPSIPPRSSVRPCWTMRPL